MMSETSDLKKTISMEGIPSIYLTNAFIMLKNMVAIIMYLMPIEMCIANYDIREERGLWDLKFIKKKNQGLNI